MNRGYQGNNNLLLLVKLRHSNYVFAKVIVLPFNHAIVMLCSRLVMLFVIFQSTMRTIAFAICLEVIYLYV